MAHYTLGEIAVEFNHDLSAEELEAMVPQIGLPITKRSVFSNYVALRVPCGSGHCWIKELEKLPTMSFVGRKQML